MIDTRWKREQDMEDTTDTGIVERPDQFERFDGTEGSVPQRPDVPAIPDDLIRAAVADAKREILIDTLAGALDVDLVSTFADTHDYTDANEYGGLTKEHSAWPLIAKDVVQGRLSAWIESGEYRRDFARLRAVDEDLNVAVHAAEALVGSGGLRHMVEVALGWEQV